MQNCKHILYSIAILLSSSMSINMFAMSADQASEDQLATAKRKSFNINEFTMSDLPVDIQKWIIQHAIPNSKTVTELLQQIRSLALTNKVFSALLRDEDFLTTLFKQYANAKRNSQAVKAELSQALVKHITKSHAPALFLVNALLAAGANPNKRATDESPILSYAVGSGNIPLVKALLAAGANVNAQDKSGMTALMEAALRNRKEIVELLLAHNADAKIRDYFDKTALQWTVNLEIQKLLASAAAKQQVSLV